MSHPNQEPTPDPTTGPAQPRPSTADQIIRSLIDNVRFIRNVEGEAYIAYPEAPHRALRVDGTKSDGMLTICQRWFASTQKWPNKDALRQVEQFVFAECMQQAVEPVHLRAASVGDAVYVDLGNPANEVVHITATGFTTATDCDAVFRRSKYTSALPSIDGVSPDVRLLQKYVRVGDEEFAVLVGCVIATWFTDIPQPIITLLGSAKAGKTTAMQHLADLIDPTTDMPGGTLTLDPRTVQAIAKIRRPLIFDNISHVAGDESDLLARVATGGEIIGRELYTNDDAHLTQLKRPILINGIIEGFARSDLASRTFQFELEDFAAGDRIAASVLRASWQADRPAVVAGLCELAAAVLAERLKSSPRDYEFHRNSDVLQIIEVVSARLGVDGIAAVRASGTRMSQTVLDASYLADCIQRLAFPEDEDDSDWSMHFTPKAFLDVALTPATLLDRLREVDERRAKDLPQTAKGLGEALRRISPDLEAVAGIRLVRSRGNKGTKYTFTLAAS